MNILPIAFGFGWQEAIPILLVVLVLFGGRKLPELARAMGTSITQFKKGLKDETDDTPKIEGGGDAGGDAPDDPKG